MMMIRFLVFVVVSVGLVAAAAEREDSLESRQALLQKVKADWGSLQAIRAEDRKRHEEEIRAERSSIPEAFRVVDTVTSGTLQWLRIVDAEIEKDLKKDPEILGIVAGYQEPRAQQCTEGPSRWRLTYKGREEFLSEKAYIGYLRREVAEECELASMAEDDPDAYKHYGGYQLLLQAMRKPRL